MQGAILDFDTYLAAGNWVADYSSVLSEQSAYIKERRCPCEKGQEEPWKTVLEPRCEWTPRLLVHKPSAQEKDSSLF